MATLPSEVPTLGGRGAWAGVGGPIAVVSEVDGTLACSRAWVDDGGGTVAGSAVNAEMSAAEAGTEVGGEFPSSDVIIRGWGALYRPDTAGAAVPGWRLYRSTAMYRYCLDAVQLVGWSWQESTRWWKK